MIASASQPRVVPSQRRIIERPRLLKLLDETDARTILLLAPAGYGKTTLARQWAKTLTGLANVRLSPAHRDFAVLAEALAEVLDPGDGEASRLVGEHIRAQTNGERAASEIGGRLSQMATSRGLRWLFVDDYHEIAGASTAEALMEALIDRAEFRLIIGSRTRPRWVTGRKLLYGEVAVVTRDELAMTEDEVTHVLGRDAATESFVRQADGWPAVIGLAASVGGTSSFPAATLPAALHDYLAQELFVRANPELQEALLELALCYDGTGVGRTGSDRLGPATAAATELGFSSSDRGFELHPLMREFLLEKLAERPDAQDRVRAAVDSHLKAGSWTHALALVVRFNLADLIESTLTVALTPLVRSGRLETIARFVTAVQRSADFPGPAVDVAGAEIALRDGNLELARDLAQRARSRMPDGDSLGGHAAGILGQIAFLLSDFEAADLNFRNAFAAAVDERAEGEALRGLASATIFGERPGAADAVKALRERSQRSPVDFIRYATNDLSYRRFGGTEHALKGPLGLDAVRTALDRAEDPIARTAMTYAAAAALSLRGEYSTSSKWLELLYEDVRQFGLDFALPYADWTAGMVALGLRKFGAAERALQAVEDAATRHADAHHQINALILRARLLLQSGETDAAITCIRTDPDAPLMPSWRGEYLATRALVFAAARKTDEALHAASAARAKTTACDVQLLALVAETIARGSRGRPRDIVEYAQRTGVWDPVVCGVRSSIELADSLALDDSVRPSLESLYVRSNDLALARRAGFRTRATGSPRELLSPREQEVLGLIARGMTNREISRALYIADSTTKVHVRHILEKLGVRTRSEAVARFERFPS